MVFIKFDCATRLRVNYLGVNVRYINNEKQAVTKTLMVKDTQSQHTSNKLKMMLRKILQEFDIPPSNVLCCVTDITHQIWYVLVKQSIIQKSSVLF